MVIEGDFRAQRLVGHRDNGPEQKQGVDQHPEPEGFHRRVGMGRVEQQKHGRRNEKGPRGDIGTPSSETADGVVGKVADGRIGNGIEQTDTEKNVSQHGHMDADHVGIEFGNVHVYRYAYDGQGKGRGCISNLASQWNALGRFGYHGTSSRCLLKDPFMGLSPSHMA